MRRHGHLDRVAHGVYRFRSLPSGSLDEFMQVAGLWPRRLGVISHDSALDHWVPCDVNPAEVHVTVQKAARLRRATPPGYVLPGRSRVRDRYLVGMLAPAGMLATDSE